jgi:hypothetical protein
MKNLIRIAVAGALAAGYHSAVLAQTAPSSDNSDLYLVVANPGAAGGGATFVEDIGSSYSINTVLPASDYSTLNNVLTPVSGPGTDLGPSAALTAFLSANPAAGDQWAIIAVQFNGTATTHPAKPGGDISIFTAPGTSSGTVAGMELGNLETIGTGFQGDYNYFSAGYTAGGKSYMWTNGSTGGNVWGAGGTSGNGGSTDLYNQGPSQAGIGLGTGATLYGVTGNSTTGELESYIIGQYVELTTTGTLEFVNTVVPLPAAVWLFGSALLGLAGVGRRRLMAGS